MKKFILLLLFVIYLCHCRALELDRFLQLSTFHYKLATYNGTAYYPERTNKEYQYLEKMIFDFGWKYHLLNNSTIWIDLSYDNDLLDKQINLESTGVFYQTTGWEFYCLYSPLEYGNHSRIFALNVLNNNYDNPLLIDYRFQGLKLKKLFPALSVTGSIGGNQLNTALLDFSLLMKANNLSTEFYSIYTGRNEYRNEKTINLGTELIYTSSLVYFYTSAVLALQMESDTERFKAVQEVILYPAKKLFLGSNLLYAIADWKKERDWTSRNTLGFDLSRFQFILSYEYQNTEGQLEHWGNRRTGFLTKFRLTEMIELGLDLNYNHPTYIDSYYQMGLQAKVKYEID